MKNFKEFTEEKQKGVEGESSEPREASGWSESLDDRRARMKADKTVDECVPIEDVVSVQPMSGPTGAMFAMKIAKTDVNEGLSAAERLHNRLKSKHGIDLDAKRKFYQDNLAKVKARQTASAENPSDVKKEVDEGIVDTVLQSKPLNRKNYSAAAKMLAKRIKADPKTDKGSHAFDVANIHRNVNSRKLETMVAGDWIQGDPILEKLGANKNSIGDYMNDFSKSDAPQFKGKSSTKRRQMAVASYLKSKRRDGERALGETIKYNSDMGVMDWGTPEGTDYMKDVTPGEKKKKLKSISIKESLPPHLQGLLDKKGNIDPKKVSKLVHKGKKTPSGSKITDVTPKGFGIRESGPAHETKAEYRKDNAEDAPELGDYTLTKTDIKDLEYEADHMSYDVALQLGIFDDDDEEMEVNILEVLSIQGRMKRRFSARQNKQKLRVARGIALRRGSSPDRLKKRARRGAKGMVYKRLLKGRDRSKLPPAEKGRLEKLIGLYAPLVSRLAVRMLPGMRKMEINRMKSRKGGAQKAKKFKAAKPKNKTQKAKKFKIKR